MRNFLFLFVLAFCNESFVEEHENDTIQEEYSLGSLIASVDAIYSRLRSNREAIQMEMRKFLKISDPDAISAGFKLVVAIRDMVDFTSTRIFSSIVYKSKIAGKLVISRSALEYLISNLDYLTNLLEYFIKRQEYVNEVLTEKIENTNAFDTYYQQQIEEKMKIKAEIESYKNLDIGTTVRSSIPLFVKNLRKIHNMLQNIRDSERKFKVKDIIKGKRDISLLFNILTNMASFVKTHSATFEKQANKFFRRYKFNLKEENKNTFEEVVDQMFSGVSKMAIKI